jgi:O-antigen/teichoic acid export membrane protein
MDQVMNEKPTGWSAADAGSPVNVERQLLLAAKGGGITFAGRMFVYGSRFVIAFVLARLLAAGQYGLYNLSLTAVELFTYLASLGLATALVRYIPHFASRRDEAGIGGTIQFSLGLTALSSLGLGVALYILAEPIAVRLFHEPRLAPLLRMVSVFVPIFSLSDMAAAATRGFKNMKYTVIAQNIAQPLIRLALILALWAVAVEMSSRWALLASGVTEIVVAGLLLFFLNKQFSLRRAFRAGRREVGMLLRFSLPVYSSNMILRLGGNLRTLLLGATSIAANVGIFAVASQLTLLGDMFHSSIVTVSQPIISELHSRGARHELARFYQIVTKWSLTINLPLFLILVLFPGPILSIFGRSFTQGAEVLGLMAWTGLVDISTGVCGVVLDMTDNTRLKLVNTIVAVGATAILSIWLIPIWGLMGAAVSMLAASIITNLLRLTEVFILFRMLPYNASFIKPVLAGAAAIGAAWIVGQALPPGIGAAGVANTAGNVIVMWAVYAGAILLLGLSPEDRAIATRLLKRAGLKR